MKLTALTLAIAFTATGANADHKFIRGAGGWMVTESKKQDGYAEAIFDNLEWPPDIHDCYDELRLTGHHLALIISAFYAVDMTNGSYPPRDALFNGLTEICAAR